MMTTTRRGTHDITTHSTQALVTKKTVISLNFCSDVFVKGRVLCYRIIKEALVYKKRQRTGMGLAGYNP